MDKFLKISIALAFFGTLGSFLLNIGNGWNSYIWQFIAMVWIANSYFAQKKLSRLEKE